MSERFVPGASKSIFTWIETDKDINFLGALALDAQATEILAAVLPINSVEIHEIVMESVQRLEWDLYFYNSPALNNADQDVDRFIDNVNMNMITAGRQIAGANQWRIGSRLENPILFTDALNQRNLYIGLIPRAPIGATKLAGAAGFVKIKIAVRPAYND